MDRALRLHLEALQLKIRGYGEDSIQAALSFNTLGETYLAIGGDKLAKAEESLRKALKVCNERELCGLEQGPRIDAAVSRDNTGRVLEAKGKVDEAREMRMKGNAMNRIMCGSNGVRILMIHLLVLCVANQEFPTSSVSGRAGAMRSAKDLQKCSACKAVFYCGATCQRKDWRARHKPLCQAFTAAAGGS